MRKYAERMNRLSGSAIREILKLMSDPEIISFGGGNPAKESFPIAAVDQIAQEIIQKNGSIILQYGRTEGYAPLRESYLEYIARPKGLTDLTEDNVLTLTGSMQGVDLVTKIFVDPGDVVLVESPTFLGSLQAFTAYQAKLVAVETDDEGVIVEDLEEKIKKYNPKLFYTIPTFQNPTGKTLGCDRRKAIAELAATYDIVVLEDDPYGDLRYRGEAMPCIKSFDTSGNVILLNSFSKILSPGLRVGVAVAASDILAKMTIAKQGSDTHTSNLSQAIADAFLRKQMLPGHLKEIIPLYAERLDAMLDALDTFFPASFRHTNPEGGLFVWGEFQDDIDVLKLLQRSIAEQKVAFVPGQHFFIDPSTMGLRTLRLNFSSAAPEQIRTGLQRLASLL